MSAFDPKRTSPILNRQFWKLGAGTKVRPRRSLPHGTPYLTSPSSHSFNGYIDHVAEIPGDTGGLAPILQTCERSAVNIRPG